MIIKYQLERDDGHSAVVECPNEKICNVFSGECRRCDYFKKANRHTTTVECLHEFDKDLDSARQVKANPYFPVGRLTYEVGEDDFPKTFCPHNNDILIGSSKCYNCDDFRLHVSDENYRFVECAKCTKDKDADNPSQKKVTGGNTIIKYELDGKAVPCPYGFPGNVSSFLCHKCRFFEGQKNTYTKVIECSHEHDDKQMFGQVDTFLHEMHSALILNEEAWKIISENKIIATILDRTDLLTEMRLLRNLIKRYEELKNPIGKLPEIVL